jgi:hypothetical protein
MKKLKGNLTLVDACQILKIYDGCEPTGGHAVPLVEQDIAKYIQNSEVKKYLQSKGYDVG